jgi:hypothetical protein
MKKILFLLLIFNLLFSAYLYQFPTHISTLNYLYNLSYGAIFVLAAIASFKLTSICKVHRPIHLSLGFGSLAFAFAQISWFVYNYYLQNEVPFPGVPDIFFISFYFLVTIGGILVMKQEIEIKFSWSLIIEIISLTAVIFFLINSFIATVAPQSNSNLLVSILSYSYPFFDSLLVVLTLTAIRSKKGRVQPLLLYFMLAFIILAVADTMFTYQTAQGLYWNGNYVDALFAVGSYLFAMGIIYLPNLLHANDYTFRPKEQNLSYNQPVSL